MRQGTLAAPVQAASTFPRPACPTPVLALPHPMLCTSRGLFTASVVLDGIDHFGSRGVTLTLPNPVTARTADGRLIHTPARGLGLRLEGAVAPAPAGVLEVVSLDSKV